MIEWYSQFTFLSCHYNIMCFSTRTVHEAIYAEREFVDDTDHVARSSTGDVTQSLSLIWYYRFHKRNKYLHK